MAYMHLMYTCIYALYMYGRQQCGSVYSLSDELIYKFLLSSEILCMIAWEFSVKMGI